jgi:hypothetical protein
VRSIGANGLVIGHWPEASGQYTFSGTIADVEVWTSDPKADITNLLAGCCLDREVLEPLFKRWLAVAKTPAGIAAYADALIVASMAVTTAVRASRPDDPNECPFTQDELQIAAKAMCLDGTPVAP